MTINEIGNVYVDYICILKVDGSNYLMMIMMMMMMMMMMIMIR